MAEPQTTPRPGLGPDPAVAAPRWRPGDARPDIASMIRVDQAGEYGATRIYAGQQAVLGARHPASRVIARMQVQEERHLRHFDEMMIDRGVRPTLLQPLWNIAGHGLGVVTALLGPEAAMACTAAVETEIDKHYGAQLEALREDDPDLSGAIAEFRTEEIEHRDTAVAAGAENSFGYPILSGLIRAGCRVAIGLSKRI
ncbi:demethoxyubiquinone hydroxylase family protein [Sphingosinicella rhizophila]|uniref:3-demethoxyubiquinol 3-hydroxylase n=1 Tax=Sphingosinicella rhizophila TaxID=3050082 RepID=A0ABU3Q428_9SPHN|nr:demethoxyubiquinone hydroxylase family protein [Sphingosinicella sp. GR2756]MDT9598171.1 demethoxyubiquinone hydroxylase family protein [Sphingosinicella sp. GR2756]